MQGLDMVLLLVGRFPPAFSASATGFLLSLLSRPPLLPVSQLAIASDDHDDDDDE
jgi:hypothetical protein